MLRSAAVPQVTMEAVVDMTEAARLREAINASADVRVSYTDLIVRAAAAALKRFPGLNARFDGERLELCARIDMGLAVALPENRGLVVPVVRDAGALSLSELAVARGDLVRRAQAGTLTPDDMAGGSFSLTNLGSYGVRSFNPLLNVPQVATLGVGAIRAPAPGAPLEVALCLTFDHRVLDGAPAAAFLQHLAALLAQPYRLL